MYNFPDEFQPMHNFLGWMLNTRTHFPGFVPNSFCEALHLDTYSDVHSLPPRVKIPYPPFFYPIRLEKISEKDFSEHYEILKQIRAKFHPSPHQLAFLYSTGAELSSFEKDRIKLEGTPHTLQILLQRLPISDPILHALAERWHNPLKIESLIK